MIRRAGLGLVVVIATTLLQLSIVPRASAAGDWVNRGYGTTDGGVTNRSSWRYTWSKSQRSAAPRAWAFYAKIAGNALDPHALRRIWTEPMPRSTSPAMIAWYTTEGWKPDRTVYSNEKTYTFTLGGGSVPVAYTISGPVSNSGELFYPIRYPEVGHHAGVWRNDGDDLCGSAHTRIASVAMMVVVNLKTDTPLWDSSHRGVDVGSWDCANL